MNDETVLEHVQEAKRTQLDRLGSGNALLAVTEAALDTDTVLRTAAESERRAYETFTTWAETEENDRVRETFETVAALEHDHYDHIASLLDVEPAAEADVLHTHLRDLSDTVSRVGAGLIGRPLVSRATTTQVISFFINEADEKRATVFRAFNDDTTDLLEEGSDLLDAICETNAERERAATAAEETIQVAYEDYAETLSGMGLDPKPIC
jgi:rubrerythrin